MFYISESFRLKIAYFYLYSKDDIFYNFYIADN